MPGRRQILKGMALAAGGALVSRIGASEAAAALAPTAAHGAGIAPAMSINHINYGVADIKRCADFQAAVFGARLQASIGSIIETMYYPGAHSGKGLWASIGSSGGESRKGVDGWDGTPGQITHVGYGLTTPNTDFPRLAAEIKRRFPGIKDPSLFRTEAGGQECMIFDPDGVAFQFIPIDHNGTLKGYSKETGKKLQGADGPQDKVSGPQEKSAAIAPVMSVNHIAFDVRNLERSMEFYSIVLGAKPKYTWEYNKMYTLELPGSTPQSGSWISINEVAADKRTGYNHVAFGLDPNADFAKIAAEITQRFPVDKQRFPDYKDPSVYKMVDWPGMDIYDADGLHYQLFQMGYDGVLPKLAAPKK